MGVTPPDPNLPSTSMSKQAIALAKESGLLNRSVFFNDTWIVYDERGSFLLDADIGVSTHFDHLETQFSFRTRILDYLWAGLPIIATKGDVFAELIEKHNLGIVIPYQDPEATAKAILFLVNHPETLHQMKKNVVKMRQEFYWATTTEPLDQMIDRLSNAPPSRTPLKDYMTMGKLALSKLRERGFSACIKALYQHFNK